MNYKIDVSLSTNEVYTLTFDYTFDESVEDKTIRLQIGDLMVETQDRRVVFKTTSSATYIKSNVRLGNVSLYEGNFLDYDQHGEYTKESYLKGATTINLVTRDMYNSTTQASVTREFTEDGFRKITKTENGSSNMGADFWGKVNFVNTSLPEDWNTVYTIIVFVRKNTFPSDISLQFSTRHRNTIAVDSAKNLKGEHDVVIKGGDTGIYKATSKICYYNYTASNRYWGCFSNAWSDTDVAIVDRTDLVGCTLEYAVMVVKGDYYDDNITIGHFFEGIGCVKSPTVFTHNKYTNITPYLSIAKQNGNIISDDRTFIDIISTGRYLGVALAFYPENVGCVSGDLFAIEFDYCCEGKGTVEKNNCPYIGFGWATLRKSNTVRFDGVGHYQNSFICTAQKDIQRVCTIDFTLNPDWNGTNKRCTISNFRVYKIDSSDEIGLYDESLVTTPNDLELHSINESVYDRLDLTTGTVIKNVRPYKYTGTWGGAEECTVSGYDDGNWWSCVFSPGFAHSSVYPIKFIYDIHFLSYNPPTQQWRIAIPKQLVPNSSDCINWIKNNVFMLIKEPQPIQEQIDLKALRSYRNGSIITDSQQLVPKLVTTLPISNKFETTKLVSGKTYNVYFDGTATELNVGGETVVANPTSPCEFTCGSTKTLTITGTDIANVMVVEKEQKNEQHEINTTSIHISKIITTNGIHNIFDEYQHQGGTQFNNDAQCISTRDRNSVKINGFGSLNYAGFGYYPNGVDKQIVSLPKGTYKFHCKVKVKRIGDSYRISLHNNPNGAKNDGNGFATDKIESTQLIEEINYIGYFGKATCMLFYTYYSGQEIEFYDISLIKLSDEDITSSSDIPNINYEETISTPSEPIVLRSYGEVQDTYDIPTGIVTKRVAQSVDSFDLGALPSPETHTVTFDNMPVIYENGTVEFYTEHDLYPVAKFEVPSLNIYDVSNLQANKQYTIRNASQIYCNEQPVPVRDVMTFTASQLAKGEMVIINSNNKEPMIIEGNFEGREIPSFVGTRSVEALEIGIDGAVNQPVFGKGGRK